MQDEPLDPFAGDPADPTSALDDDLAGPEGRVDPLSAEERQDVLDDLADLDVYETLLSTRGIRGLVVDCEDCRIPHYFAWDLLRANLRHLLDAGRTRVHEPAFDPDPTDYVTWEYARGYADGTQDALEDQADEDELDAPAGLADVDTDDADADDLRVDGLQDLHDEDDPDEDPGAEPGLDGDAGLDPGAGRSKSSP